ncbi:MAG: hypothetical protein CML06_18770 [Pseudomonadales bacterium]|nr:hypothetical protein [Pseudomonadales bacterium]
MILNLLWLALTPQAAAQESAATKAGGREALWRCLSQQVVALARDRQLLAAVNNYNAAPPDPQALDRRWPELTATDPLLQGITQSPAAHQLRRWIQEHSIQGEGLLIGDNGGLAAATDKTTDFWQGDEAQFLEAVKLADGDVYIQSELPDASTNMMLLKISTPLYNARSPAPVGVLVIGFDQFVIDFIEPCPAD